MRTVMPVLGGLATAIALVSGCDLAAGLSAAPTVSKDALQTEIADRLTKAGERPQSVTCKEDLVGEVGHTARCDVVLSPTNSFEPVITVTGVDGATIDYEVTPAVSKQQLETAVARLVSAAGVLVASVSCESGLDGQVGAVAYCDVEVGGVKVRRTVQVYKVDGLLMNFDLQPI
jgi:hypothetical protein